MRTKYYLSACLMFKNSSAYLEEWLAFYSVLGVEHFFLYNNDSTDGFHEAVRPHLARGSATLIDFQGQGVQKEVFDHCLREFGNRTRWMMFCDDDEFLFPVADVSLPIALQKYEAFAGVAVSWMLFGSSGYMVRQPGFVIDSYRRRAAAPDQHVKCVIDPSRIECCEVIAHQFRCKHGNVIVDEKMGGMNGPFSLRPSVDVLRINHYLTKSREELIQRRSRVQANTGIMSPLSVEAWLRLEGEWNQVEDASILRYVPRMERFIASLREVPPVSETKPALSHVVC